MLALICSSSLYSVDESVLWLPLKYSDLLPSLIKISEHAETRPNCLKVTQGKLSNSRNPENQKFLITCMDTNRSSTNFIYLESDVRNNFSSMSIYDIVEEVPELTEEELMEDPLYEEKRQARMICEEGIRAKYKSENSLLVYNGPGVNITMKNNGNMIIIMTFNINADGPDIAAVCLVKPGGALNLQINHDF